MAQIVQPQPQQVVAEKQTISLVMPVYNLENEIHKISNIANLMQKRLGENFELIVVDDGSTDNTLSLARKMQDKRLRVVGYPKNMGKGAAQMYGYTHAQGSIVVFMDGDLQAIPQDIQNYIDALSESDIAVASKRISGSYLEAGTKRKFLSIGFNLLVRMLTSLQISDTQVGFKVFRRSALEWILPLLSVKRYAFDVELLTVAKLLNLKITELPAHVILLSNFRKKNMARMLIDLLGITYRLRVKRWYHKSMIRYEGPYEPVLRW